MRLARKAVGSAPLAAVAIACTALVIPRPGLCTDNGAMIGAAGARRFAAGERSGLDLDARPSLPLALCTDNAAMIASAARWTEPLPYPRYLALDAYASR